MPIQKWTCETCGKSYDKIQDASLCELTHSTKPKPSSRYASNQVNRNSVLEDSNALAKLSLEQEDQQWGAHINGSTPEKSERCPDWVKSTQSSTWREHGILIIWDKTIQQITRLRAADALEILNHLQTTGTELGITVGHPVSHIGLKQPDQKPQVVLSDKIDLDATQSQALLKFLQDNEPLLKNMAEANAKQWNDALRKVYKIFIQARLRRMREEEKTP